jgi:hypothetical protein
MQHTIHLLEQVRLCHHPVLVCVQVVHVFVELAHDLALSIFIREALNITAIPRAVLKVRQQSLPLRDQKCTLIRLLFRFVGMPRFVDHALRQSWHLIAL